MSQWGAARRFGRGGTRIRVMPDVDTGGAFEPSDKGKIADLFLLNIEFIPQLDRAVQRQAADRMLGELKNEYVGRPYYEWAEPVTVL